TQTGEPRQLRKAWRRLAAGGEVVAADAQRAQPVWQRRHVEGPARRPSGPQLLETRKVAERLRVRHDRLAEEQQLVDLRKGPASTHGGRRDDGADRRVIGERVEVDDRLAGAALAARREHLLVTRAYAFDRDEMARVAERRARQRQLVEREPLHHRGAA